MLFLKKKKIQNSKNNNFELPANQYYTQCTAISIFFVKVAQCPQMYLGKVTRAFSDQSNIFGAP